MFRFDDSLHLNFRRFHKRTHWCLGDSFLYFAIDPEIVGLTENGYEDFLHPFCLEKVNPIFITIIHNFYQERKRTFIAESDYAEREKYDELDDEM